jgi:hypothetical protein
MISIAHIINPVLVDISSDLNIAQPITFETMRSAKEFSKNSVDVRLYTVQYHDEERIPLPDVFIRVPDITRSITDIKSFKQKRKLPLIRDILDTLYKSTDADYMIYTNVDIALQPYFYLAVDRFIKQGYDSFVINRRTISDTYTSLHEIPIMAAEIGESHKGYDCFVFKRELYPKFKLGTICIGTAWIGRALLANMVSYSTKFREFRNEHLTFHIGDPCSWRKEEYNDYFKENWNEYLSLFNQIEAELGTFDPVLRSYLLDAGEKRIIPDFDKLGGITL